MKSDRPSWFSRTLYGLEKMRTPFRSELNGISWSENSSRSSLTSVSTTSTAATSIADEDEYDSIEDILVAKPDASVQHNFTNAQSTFRDDLHNHLNEALGSHEYLSRLRLVGKDSFSFRPAVLITTKSRETKMVFARYLRKGPSILRRLAAVELDIHIVLHNFGLAGDNSSTSSSSIFPGTETSFYFDSDAKSDAAYLTARDDKSGKQTTSVSTIKLEVGGELVMLSVYHPLTTFDKSQTHWQQAARRFADIPEPKEHCGAVSIYFDEVFPEDLSPSNNSTEINSSLADDTFHSKCYNTVDQECYAREAGALHPISSTSAAALGVRNSGNNNNARGPSALPASNHDRVLTTRLLSYSEDADWSLWSLPSRDAQHQSMLTRPNQVNGQTISDFCQEGCAAQKQVNVILPEGNVQGKMQSETVLYQIGPKQLRLQVMSLSRPLERGKSGALVTLENQACGMVVAVDDDFAEAYVLSFDQIISDVQRVIRKTVNLPSITCTSDETSTVMPSSSLVFANEPHHNPEVLLSRVRRVKISFLLLTSILGCGFIQGLEENCTSVSSLDNFNAFSFYGITRVLHHVVNMPQVVDIFELLPDKKLFLSLLLHEQPGGAVLCATGLVAVVTIAMMEVCAEVLYSLPMNRASVKAWKTMNNGMQALLAQCLWRISEYPMNGRQGHRRDSIMQRSRLPCFSNVGDIGDNSVKAHWHPYRTILSRLLRAVPNTADTLVSNQFGNFDMDPRYRIRQFPIDLALDASDIYKEHNIARPCFGLAYQTEETLVSYPKLVYGSRLSSQASKVSGALLSITHGSALTSVGQSHHCKACDKSFGKRIVLRKREARREREFFCALENCHLYPNMRSDLERHQSRIHQNTSEKRFMCADTGCYSNLVPEAVLRTYNIECDSDWLFYGFDSELNPDRLAGIGSAFSIPREAFKARWHARPRGKLSGCPDDRHTPASVNHQSTHSKLRWTLVAKSKKGHCLWVPILSYAHNGLTRKRISKEECRSHAILTVNDKHDVVSSLLSKSQGLFHWAHLDLKPSSILSFHLPTRDTDLNHDFVFHDYGVNPRLGSSQAIPENEVTETGATRPPNNDQIPVSLPHQHEKKSRKDRLKTRLRRVKETWLRSHTSKRDDEGGHKRGEMNRRTNQNENCCDKDSVGKYGLRAITMQLLRKQNTV